MQNQINPMQTQQVQVNPVVFANDIHIQIMNLLNTQRQIIVDLTKQLDEIKRPATQGNLVEYDAQRRVAAK